MRADEVFEFTVQLYDYTWPLLTQGERKTVVARSACEAAQRLLGEDLITHGQIDDLRANVWRIGPQHQPIRTPLYRKRAAPSR